ncbi:hypothetical protein [Nonomuraea sp. NEAU-A123]|uniref:hypothetical protein n=1 Tax=Nonomuraea sp. NEAU-A123 TaxID=2839649 RepID=UPI001BE42E6E|nr:hypothetical protein [Nonomuraea sp. NEAU-A123]MBT2232193.1 hypothetical protein [Nonomuraea sp. NEAU-A123]
MALHIPESTTSSGTYVPEFRDVEQRPDGTWTAVHYSGKVITAPTRQRLEYIEAPTVRILHTWGRPAS